MKILGVETSCDETAAAVLRGARQVLSNAVYSQVALHGPHGGIVPETAARAHLEHLPRILREAVAQSGCAWEEIDRIAVTRGPGLAGALITGLSAARGLALRLDRPLSLVNHVEAHLLSPFLSPAAPDPEAFLPAPALVVSGGHTVLYLLRAPGDAVLLGQTLDDAAGEAFDKAARLLGLGYPGGPAIARIAEGASPGPIRFPTGRPRPGTRSLGGLHAEFCWSFSGLKTALMRYLHEHPPRGTDAVARIAAAFQEAIVTAIVERCAAVVRHSGIRRLLAGGGVIVNARLRKALGDWAAEEGIALLLAPSRYCGDNAAMIAAAAALGAGIDGDAAMKLDIAPSWTVGTP